MLPTQDETDKCYHMVLDGDVWVERRSTTPLPHDFMPRVGYTCGTMRLVPGFGSEMSLTKQCGMCQYDLESGEWSFVCLTDLLIEVSAQLTATTHLVVAGRNRYKDTHHLYLLETHFDPILARGGGMVPADVGC
ncbi:hypothetical protein KIPB_008835 [Kipferlia bialata]|uniref:Uncharacterized protein n=1 Tax=Kipferlia bialata TaxID=797122 RepID=A0A9K3D293_9EUKA|nr:hypothetical protein KIPB_008835 [Kipferlia bialata]|eukprot:g8835.t1